MKITKFWAKGYRSLRDVTLGPIGDFTVFYGPNGSGKSNLLAAIEALLRCVSVINRDEMAQLLNTQSRTLESSRATQRAAGDFAFAEAVVSSRDFTADAPLRASVLGAHFVGDANGSKRDALGFERLTLEVSIDEIVAGQPRLWLSALSLDDVDAPQVFQTFEGGIDGLRAVLARVCDDFAIVHADRGPRREALEAPKGTAAIVPWHLREGRLKNALFAASTSTHPNTRRRLRDFRSIMEGPPLRRPPFDAVHDPRTNEVDVREPLGRTDVSLELAGLGVAQVYAAMAGVMLNGAGAVAIEEPEAHLHAPTLGRDLRGLLERAVSEGYVDQLFIATHSNLFDLDPQWYWDVSLERGETRVQRRPLDELDARHLYEPGPAKHALLRSLEYLDPDVVVFRHLADGSPVTAAMMCDLLRRDAPEADAYLDAVYGNAVRSVRRLAQTTPQPKPGQPT